MSTNSKILKRLMTLFSEKSEQQETQYDEVIPESKNEQLIYNIILESTTRALSISTASENKVREASISFVFDGGQIMDYRILLNEDGMLTYNTKVSETIGGVQNTVLEYVDTHGDELGNAVSQTIN